jgi:hypothetical protein
VVPFTNSGIIHNIVEGLIGASGAIEYFMHFYFISHSFSAIGLVLVWGETVPERPSVLCHLNANKEVKNHAEAGILSSLQIVAA